MVEVEKKFLDFKFKIGNSAIERTLFIKQHDGSDSVKPNDRSLFIVNIPQFLTKKYLKALFISYGPIENVYIQSKPSSGVVDSGSKYFSQQEKTVGSKVGYIVFKRDVSLKKALKVKSHIEVIPKVLRAGNKKWIKEYNSHFIDAKELHEEIESFMSEFDQNIEDEKEKDKGMEGVADEEGWVTVTKQSKKPKIKRNEVTSQRLLERQKRAQAKQTLINFYKCQIRNAKMDEILELRKKFETDKKRLALMKAGRKFKPI